MDILTCYRMDKRKKMRYLVKETVAYYEEHPRSTMSVHVPNANPLCVFNSEGGAHCAVGRHFRPEFKAEGAGLSWNTRSIEWLSNAIRDRPATIGNGIVEDELNSFDDLLVEEVRGFPLRFWVALQGVHDDPDYWGEGGLTESGEAYRSELLDQIEMRKFD